MILPDERVQILDILAAPASSLEEGQGMSVRFREIRVEEYVKLAGPFVVTFLFGVAARITHPWYPLDWPPVSTVDAIADAFIVAGLIGLLIELYSVRFLIQRVASDLAERLVGRGLPPELQGHIRNIVETVFVRNNYVKSYSFSGPTGGNFQIVITLDFEVRNYSDSVKEYTPVVAEERIYEPEFLLLEYGIPGTANYYSFGAGQLAGCIETTPGTQAKVVRGPKSIKLDPVQRGGGPCRVTWRYRVKMPEAYSDVMSFVMATIGIRVRVEQIPPDYEFLAGEGAFHQPGSLSWDFTQPFVGGQHIRSWWYRKPEIQPPERSD